MSVSKFSSLSYGSIVIHAIILEGWPSYVSLIIDFVDPIVRHTATRKTLPM